MNPSKRDALRRLIARHAREATTMTPEAAKAYLVRLGTHTPDGRIAPEYGGGKAKKAAPHA